MRQSKGHCVRCVAKCHSGLEGGNRAEASIFENARDGKEREGQRERPTQVRGWPAGREVSGVVRCEMGVSRRPSINTVNTR